MPHANTTEQNTSATKQTRAAASRREPAHKVLRDLALIAPPPVMQPLTTAALVALPIAPVRAGRSLRTVRNIVLEAPDLPGVPTTLGRSIQVERRIGGAVSELAAGFGGADSPTDVGVLGVGTALHVVAAGGGAAPPDDVAIGVRDAEGGVGSRAAVPITASNLSGNISGQVYMTLL